MAKSIQKKNEYLIQYDVCYSYQLFSLDSLVLYLTFCNLKGMVTTPDNNG